MRRYVEMGYSRTLLVAKALMLCIASSFEYSPMYPCLVILERLWLPPCSLEHSVTVASSRTLFDHYAGGMHANGTRTHKWPGARDSFIARKLGASSLPQSVQTICCIGSSRSKTGHMHKTWRTALIE